MTRSDVLTRFVGIVAECAFNVMPEQYDVPLSDLGIDSLEFVELIMNTETAFNITILEREAALLSTVNDFTDFITKRLAA